MATRTVRYRKGQAKDMGAIKSLFDEVLPKPYPAEVYAKIGKGIESGKWGDNMQIMAILAIDEGHLAGAIVTTTMGVQEAREKGQVTFDLLEKSTPQTKSAYIMMMGVGERYRRREVGTQLVFEGLRKLIEVDPNIECAFLHCLEDDEQCNEFYTHNDFTLMGHIPDHYDLKSAGKKASANVWARAFHSGELSQYKKQPSTASASPNLADAGLEKVKKTPKWIVDCAVQFLLPIGIVGLLFLISYGLVLAGPLKGISRKFMKGSDEPDDGDEQLDPSGEETDL